MYGLSFIGLFVIKLLLLHPALSFYIEPEDSRSVDRNGINKRLLTLDEVLYSEYGSRPFNGTWISETEIIYRVNDKILAFDVHSKTTKTIAQDRIFEQAHRFALSPDKRFILITTVVEPVYRYTSKNIYTVYSIRNRSSTPLAGNQLISVAVWSPRGSSIIYVLNNDIYYHEIIGDIGETRRITFDGKPEILFNGIPDWIYEEEVFSSDSALWVSPNGEYLAFATFNDSEVRDAPIMKYGLPGDLEYQYPKEEKIKYPKPGTANPQVTLNLVDLTDHGSSIVTLQAPTDIVGPEPILYVVQWFDSKTLSATWTNRVQTQSQIVTYSLTGMWHPLLYQEVKGGWIINPGEAPILRDRYLYLIKPQLTDNGTLGTFEHLTRFDLLNGHLNREVDLTPGEMTVISIIGVNELKRVIYFTGAPNGEPSQKHLFSVSLQVNRETTPRPKCLSCEHRTPEGRKCGYVSASFSTDFSNYVLSCQGPDPPTIKVYDIDDKEVYTWGTNEELRKFVSHRILPNITDLYVESHGFMSKVRLILPNDFDPSKKYPMIVKVYAGPGSQQINDFFSIGYQTYLTTSKHVIHALIDGRGSSVNRGSSMLYQVYRDLGNAEVEDQITVTRKLQQMFTWIDANRTAVWGWSYGGYATAMILAKDVSDVFKCGISVAPVTSWIYYDTIYTERYMGLPTEDDNLRNYEKGDVTKLVGNLRKKKFMLVHGTGDDNVHYQQSMALAKALAEADVLFDQISYPDEAHSLSHVTRHLYHSITHFWELCLRL